VALLASGTASTVAALRSHRPVTTVTSAIAAAEVLDLHLAAMLRDPRGVRRLCWLDLLAAA
jgi:hypothetical protein